MKFTEQLEQQIYNEFISIEPGAYQEQIRYFDNNRSEIRQLPYEYQTFIECKYAKALFEVKDYYGFLTIVDRLITLVIRDNIYEIDGVDVYKDLLYCKAYSTHKILDYYKADHIYSELVKIDPDNVSYNKGYLQNAVEKKRYEVKYLNAVSIILFFLAAGIICIELLMIRTFYQEWTQTIEYTRNFIFLGGIFVLVFLEAWIRISSLRSLKVLKQK
jgi:tetratricopeptide (TPR) repeat protein